MKILWTAKRSQLVYNTVYYLFSCYNIAQLYPYNQGQLCAVNTTTGLVYTESSTKGGTYEVLDSVNCTEYKLSHTNNANSGEVILSVPLPVFEKSYRNLIVSNNCQ